MLLQCCLSLNSTILSRLQLHLTLLGIGGITIVENQKTNTRFPAITICNCKNTAFGWNNKHFRLKMLQFYLKKPQMRHNPSFLALGWHWPGSLPHMAIHLIIYNILMWVQGICRAPAIRPIRKIRGRFNSWTVFVDKKQPGTAVAAPPGLTLHFLVVD